MLNNIQEQSLDSAAFFKSIMRFKLHPMEEVCSEPTHKKGDVIYKRNLFTGFRKKAKKVYTEDTWDRSRWGEPLIAPMNIHQYAAYFGYLVRDNRLYSKPYVFIETSNKNNNRTIKFNSNEEAFEYMRKVKEKCAKFGNKLL